MPGREHGGATIARSRVGARRQVARVLGVGLGLALLTGCGQVEWNYAALRDVNVTLPTLPSAESARNRAGTPGEPLSIVPGGTQSVLVAVKSSEDPEHVAYQWGRAFVVVLDGPPAKGRVEVSPANGRLIFRSPRRPARQPYAALEGYVDIRSVQGGKVEAYCVLRNELIDAYDESFILRGFYTFVPATGSESFLHRGGVDVAGALR